jgi:formamidopyrimidine-DNA glycosylase
MPELPEVEILARHLQPSLRGKRVTQVNVLRSKTVAPTTVGRFRQTLLGAEFRDVSRRGKYLIFDLTVRGGHLQVIGHLGMTGRMYLLPRENRPPKHAAVVLGLGPQKLVFEDTRYFGRMTLETEVISGLGPEPLSEDFDLEGFVARLKGSRQAIKIKLLDQSLVAGIGNIYASEALFRAGISPKTAAHRLRLQQIERLLRGIREVLREAIACGSTVPLNFGRQKASDRLFYFGRPAGTPDFYEERLCVYDREGRPCPRCATPIRRIVQAARSTFFCPKCQISSVSGRYPVRRRITRPGNS